MGTMQGTFALAAGLALVAGAAGAVTQTQIFVRGGVSDSEAIGTGGGGSGSYSGIEASLFNGATFGPFDTSLGTLLSASVDYDVELSLTGTADYYQSFDPGSGAGFYDGEYALILTLDFDQFQPAGGPGDDAILLATGAREAVPIDSAPSTETIAASTSLVGSAALDLMQASGPDPFIFELTGLAMLDGFNVEVDAQAAFTGTITVTYTYDDGAPPPPIPLPAGLPLLLGALGALAVLRGRR